MTATTDPGARIADALERIATALEQGALEQITKPALAGPNDFGDLDDLASAPPVPFRQPQPVAAPQVNGTVPPQPAGLCPVHGTPWNRLVPAGTSRKTGKPFNAFWACPTTGCDQRPPR